MISPIYDLLWPGVACAFLLTAVVCFVCRRWVFGIGLSIPGVLLLGTWRYDCTHEQVSKLHVALLENKLVNENREHPENSLFYVRVTALEMGSWEGKLRAADIHLTGPGTIVTVEIGKRPLTGSYLKSVANLDYGQPASINTYAPPPRDEKFK
jgi:hypothetical protein